MVLAERSQEHICEEVGSCRRGGTGHFVGGPKLQQSEEDLAQMIVERNFLARGS